MPQQGDADSDAAPGEAIVRVSWIGTAAFGVTSALGAAVAALDVVALVVALAMFAAGTVAFFLAFAQAVARSRTEQVGILSLFFLEGRVAPKPVRRLLLGSFLVEIAVAVAVAAVRPNTSLAFGILAPVYGLALAGLWGARHGVFPERVQKR
ncbi:MAG TPA: hypothetical protein VM938_15040 [Acidimicrobiales bacterium]|nr:hypothetical protein [Acidimicrobiales bacterium]